MGLVSFIKSINFGLRHLKRGNHTDNETVIACPLCFSTSLRAKANPYVGLLVPLTRYCPDCGYVGTLYAEVDVTELEGLQKFIREEFMKTKDSEEEE